MTRRSKRESSKHVVRRVSRRQRDVAETYYWVFIDPKVSGIQKMSDNLVNSFTFFMPSFIKNYVSSLLKRQTKYRYVGNYGYGGIRGRSHNFNMLNNGSPKYKKQ